MKRCHYCGSTEHPLAPSTVANGYDAHGNFVGAPIYECKGVEACQARARNSGGIPWYETVSDRVTGRVSL